MEVRDIQHTDLPFLSAFQPPDWQDILPSFRFYIDAPFCRPIKVMDHGDIVGIGTTIVHGDVAWLATIITHPQKRNQGIGSFVTQALIESLKHLPCRTIMLVATPMGEPVYEKLGFKTDSRYLFFKDGPRTSGREIAPDIIPFDPKYTNEILALDRIAYGEDRGLRVRQYLPEAKLYVENGRVEGFYLPAWGEGPVIAENATAGNALLYVKHITASLAVMPEQNIAAADYIKNLGYTEFRKAARMRLGEKFAWRPEMIYSRVAGAIG